MTHPLNQQRRHLMLGAAAAVTTGLLPTMAGAAAGGPLEVVTLVSDYGPGMDAEKTFVTGFTKGGGKIVESLRVPLRNPD